ncbi:hypothetical protein D3874_01915 [Oleomonas cavernae]|uniref:SRP54-type proteins GTP-binding domain-containing protein n=1 Tax=Oleomonas cavernae TaxID=2320859 RepID=A0A418WTL7_9PROT|nr:hypothetical protein [Oleomonas cavernae]RJF94611.1 hypothetical protein D3874_01915 [Oleomonas cavernae]
MRLRTFHAPNMATAMDDIRRALGTEAIIVSTRRAARGTVEVVAAVEDTTLAAVTPAPRPAEAKAEAALDRRLERLLGQDPAEERQNELFTRQIARALDHHRTPRRQITRLTRAAGAFVGAAPSDALAHALSGLLRFSPLSTPLARSIMLVGPPGVGKTVVTAKIAARAALDGAPLRVISTDTLKAGATAQLEAYLRALEQPLGLAASPAELAKLEHAGGRSRRAVIDTAGVNPFAEGDMTQLTRLLAAADVEPVLVLAAGTDSHDAMDIARVFSRLGVRRMIATRLDATRRIGSLIAAAEAGHMALAEVSASPFVAQGLRPLDAVELAQRLMQDYDEPQADSDFEEAAQ